jgi:N-acetylmuramoyl-L-alanine amidase
MLAPLCAALALVLATPASARHPRAAGRPPAAKRRARADHSAPSLERARALLAEVKRDPAKRRYRHHWERAIAALERAARGRQTAPALLEAARARYALYRFSQVDADRDAALRLALRAKRAGAREAAAFAAAVRREMGEDEEPGPARKAGPRSKPAAAVAAAAKPSAAPPEKTEKPKSAEKSQEAESSNDAEKPKDSDEEAATEPVLEKALSDADADEPPAAGPARVSDVKSWSNSDYTRVAVYLSRPVGFTKEEIPADGDRPRRLALDLKPARLGRGLAHPVGDSLVERVRAAQRDADTVRVVLDLAGSDELAIFSLDDPPRLIVDVGVREAEREAHESALQRGEGELGERRPVRRIIVDAGHGGHDTGAIGPTRVREKDVTLAMAKRLAARLRAKGFEVVLTRQDDRYVALEERTAIANARHGDLFVSIHANAHPRRDRRGVETYVLNVADDRYAARLAARENGTLGDGAAGQEVRRILADLDAQSSAEASRRLAESVQRQVCAGIRSRLGEVRDLGVKSALFYVLLGARMPAVLLETSFISNRAEEKRLQSPRFQEEIAASVARAIEEFAARQAKIAAR